MIHSAASRLFVWLALLTKLVSSEAVKKFHLFNYLYVFMIFACKKIDVNVRYVTHFSMRHVYYVLYFFVFA